MKIPFVIDNQDVKLADVLNQLLASYVGRSLDVASAFFSVKGFELLRENLENVGSFRLLLGLEPTSGQQLGVKTEDQPLPRLLSNELEDEEFNQVTMRIVEDLIRFLRKSHVEVRLIDKGFLHAKCYLLYGDKPGGQGFLFERFQPLIGIVGSSNFTFPGLTSNRELNLCHRILLDMDEALDPGAGKMVSYLSESKSSPNISDKNIQLLKSEIGARAIMQLTEWYENAWAGAVDFKEQFIEILDASKFGTKEYTPYQVYMKALFEYFKDDLDTVETGSIRSAVELAEFQEDAVKKARKILARYDGVMIADSVGLGKTWIGKKLLEDFAYHMRMKALVICPASLRQMWAEELTNASIAATILSQEELGQKEFPADRYSEADVILIDESHNFRNKVAQRYDNLDRVIALNGGKGKDGTRKKIILLTATPINNDLFDLYNQINFIIQGDRSYFSSAGIGDVYKYFQRARHDFRNGTGLVSIFNLLEEIVIRRTRPFIRKAYPQATINGEKVFFPSRKLKTVNYDLEATYKGIYEDVVVGVESLKLAPYNLEFYKKAGEKIDEFEAGREEALVGIFKSRYLKRFESSIEAFRISVKRALQFQKTFESYLLDGKLLNSSDFQKALRYIIVEDEEDDGTPISLADQLDEKEEIRQIIEQLPTVDPAGYDLRRLHEALQHDIETLTKIWQKIINIRAESDAKLIRLKNLLTGELKGQKVLLFTYYKDTARYIYRELTGEKGEGFREKAYNPLIRRMDSGAKPDERVRIVQEFAPKANRCPELMGSEKEIDILISTDVLSEGQNLQDCGYLLNYDLHWNPTRMVQRAGRIDRIGSTYDTLWIYNMFPDEGLENLLGLVESLSNKIANIDRAGFLDASVLGEVVHPRNFNTLKRIEEEDGSVIDEEEQFTELVSNEFLLQQLKNLLNAGGKEMLSGLPDGIHSGLVKPRAKGMFFYFTGKVVGEISENHFWKYYDIQSGEVLDNRFLIANMISCDKDTPRVIGDCNAFEIQEKVIQNILETQEKVQALELTPKTIDPIQQTIATTFQGYLNSPKLDRKALIQAIKYLNQPFPGVQVKEMKKSFKRYQEQGEIGILLDEILKLEATFGSKEPNEVFQRKKLLRREDLKLICFDYLCL
ncbi:MAG: helicase-related protein [Bacteroidota bacterium]